VNCSPSPLLSGLPLSPLPPFPVCIQYTYCIPCVKGGGDGVLGLGKIKTCRKVPLQVNFLMTTFCIAFYESYLPQLSCQTESRKTKREEREVTGMAKIADGDVSVSLKPILTTAKTRYCLLFLILMR
jgi:hypothetical protein